MTDMAKAFRFDPPEVGVTPALRWVLARAYAVSGPGLTIEETEGDAAAELALRCGLAARIAGRQSADRLVGELGSAAAAKLKRQRAHATAQEMHLIAALAEADGAAAELRCPYALLQGQALVLGAFAPEGGRPSADLELLVPEGKFDVLGKELLQRGLTVAGEAGERPTPALLHRSGGVVVLQRVAAGVRLEGKRAATFEALAAADLLGPPPGAMRFRPKGDLRLPRRELLTAQALVHLITQHGLAPEASTGFLLLADLVDLAFRGSGGRASLASIAPWIARDVRFEEADAALQLATALAAADPELLRASGAGRSPARLLLDHFHAALTDPRYVAAMRMQPPERALSEGSPRRERADLAAESRVQPRQEGIGGTSRGASGLALFGRFASRPIEWARRWRAARAAARPRRHE